ncbi:heterokaryon incompatibility protein-domain-containing protein [Hypoxylon sp. FL1857]|nr:heterokaryon incompatibility protein-domain-containing protein [Hypoxylon sp. FL1857]
MDEFKYNSLDLKQRAFRLVRLHKGRGRDIECELIYTTFDKVEKISYEAVSYTWGSSSKTFRISVQGKMLSVTLNLYLILRDLRHSNADRYLWIDAICINQEDVHERGHQVEQMKDIYSEADRVLFCVGRPTKLTNILMASLAGFQKETSGNNWDIEDVRWRLAWGVFESRMKKLYPSVHKIHRRAIVYLLNQSWFRRVWILQEVGNAKSALVYCGRAFVSARVFAVSPSLIGVKPDVHCEAVLNLMPGPSRKPSELKRDLYSLLRTFSRAEAQDERDKVYALLGMCQTLETNKTLIPDYAKSVHAVIRDTTPHVCQCDVESLPEELCSTMGRFLDNLGHLYTIALISNIKSTNTMSVLSFFKDRGSNIDITQDVVAAVRNGGVRGVEVLKILLQQLQNQIIAAIGADSLLHWLKGAIYRGLVDAEGNGSGEARRPLELAAEYGYLEAIQLLMSYYAKDPLQLSAPTLQDTESPPLLPDHDVSRQTGEYFEREALLLAIKKGLIEASREAAHMPLAEYKQLCGWTPLPLAARFNRSETAQILLLLNDRRFQGPWMSPCHLQPFPSSDRFISQLIGGY